MYFKLALMQKLFEDNNRIIEIYKKKQSQRSEDDIDFLVEFVKNIPLFKDFINKEDPNSEELYYELVKYLKFEIKTTGTNLYHKGDWGNKFYYIIRGKVNSYQPKSQIQLYKEYELSKIIKVYFLLQIDKNNIKLKNMSEEDLLLYNRNNRKNTYIYKDILQYNFERHYKDSQYFGETQLLSNQPRTSTCLCAYECFFLTLSKKEFTHMFGKRQQNQQHFMLETLKKYKVKDIHFFESLFRLEKFHKDEFIYRQGQQSDTMYYLQEGQVQVIWSNDGQNNEDDRNYFEELEQNKFEMLDNLNIHSQKKKQKEFDKHLIKLYTIEQGQFFGIYDIVKNIPRTFSIKVSTIDGIKLKRCSKEQFINIKHIIPQLYLELSKQSENLQIWIDDQKDKIKNKLVEKPIQQTNLQTQQTLQQKKQKQQIFNNTLTIFPKQFKRKSSLGALDETKPIKNRFLSPNNSPKNQQQFMTQYEKFFPNEQENNENSAIRKISFKRSELIRGMSPPPMSPKTKFLDFDQEQEEIDDIKDKYKPKDKQLESRVLFLNNMVNYNQKTQLIQQKNVYKLISPKNKYFKKNMNIKELQQINIDAFDYNKEPDPILYHQMIRIQTIHQQKSKQIYDLEQKIKNMNKI